jgi:hypothetical protein
MQNYGTNVRREDDEDYWVDEWRDGTWSYMANDIVADDVRFKNEAAAVKELGGILIKIVRPDYPSTDIHQSEVEMDEIEPDHTIVANTGNQQHLYSELDRIYAEHTHP